MEIICHVFCVGWAALPVSLDKHGTGICQNFKSIYDVICSSRLICYSYDLLVADTTIIEKLADRLIIKACTELLAFIERLQGTRRTSLIVD